LGQEFQKMLQKRSRTRRPAQKQIGVTFDEQGGRRASGKASPHVATMNPSCPSLGSVFAVTCVWRRVFLMRR
jgi:hypothetical protein